VAREFLNLIGNEIRGVALAVKIKLDLMQLDRSINELDRTGGINIDVVRKFSKDPKLIRITEEIFNIHEDNEEKKLAKVGVLLNNLSLAQLRAVIMIQDETLREMLKD